MQSNRATTDRRIRLTLDGGASVFVPVSGRLCRRRSRGRGGRAASEEFFVLPLFLDFGLGLWIQLLHVLQLRRRQFIQMPDEVHQLPAVFVMLSPALPHAGMPVSRMPFWMM